jgi:hypothetical protein
MNDDPWRQLAQRQRGMVARRQFRALGIVRHVIHGNVAAGRWVLRTDRVVSTFTGPLLFEHRLWLGVLHAGGNALIGGLSAAAVHGLRRWDRPSVTVLVDDRLAFEAVPGVEFVRTRRDLRALRTENSDLPLCRIEPAALLFAGYCHSERTALGLLAALVQQELTDPEKLAAWVRRLRPLRRARLFQQAIDDIAGGSQSLGELDVARFLQAFRSAPSEPTDPAPGFERARPLHRLRVAPGQRPCRRARSGRSIPHECRAMGGRYRPATRPDPHRPEQRPVHRA